MQTHSSRARGVCQPTLHSNTASNPIPQEAPGSAAAIGHVLANSIPVNVFPQHADKLCVCFCGLPGRGKTHIARRLGRYLSFFHALPVQNFNVGEYRRRLCGAIKDADWFSESNTEAMEWRNLCNHQALSDCSAFLENVTCGIAIIDGTNGTHEKRRKIQTLMRSQGVKVLFIEVQNDSAEFLRYQFEKAAETMPDYQNMPNHEAATEDYHRRVDNYIQNYESLSVSHPVEKKWSFMVCNHEMHHYQMHNVRGHVPLQISTFVANMRTTNHAFYLSRHGQSQYNSEGKIGGDSGLTTHGLNYAQSLADFAEEHIMRDEHGNSVPARLWTSTMRRTIETAQFIKNEKITVRSREDPTMEQEWVQMRPRRLFLLDEIFAGSCDGMTYEEMMGELPEEFKLRQIDKLSYRYPRGESYLDVISRLQPVIVEMESHREPLLIVGHQGILRIIYAFYMGLSRNEAPYVSIPLNSVLELRPQAFHCTVKEHKLYSPTDGTLESDGQDEPV